jgi:hypothetical protein
MAMYMKSPASEDVHQGVRLYPAAAGAIALSVVAVLVFGFWPRGALEASVHSTGTLSQMSVPVARK